MTTHSNIEQKVIAVLDGLGIEYEVIPIDPDLADTAEFCEAYGYAVETCGNTILVASKKPAGQYSACVVKGSDGSR